jgi:hypothetical protein
MGRLSKSKVGSNESTMPVALDRCKEEGKYEVSGARLYCAENGLNSYYIYQELAQKR